MYLLTASNNVDSLSLFKEKKKTKESSKVKGIAQIAAGGYVGQQAIRSGVPRVLGVRLEQHGTSRKSAKTILLNGGKLDPRYGGSTDGVTASMKLPKEFLERAKGHVFVSGKNKQHPNYKKRIPIINDIGDVLTRKVQVAGYRGSKAGKITDKHIERGQKHLATLADNLMSKAYETHQKNNTYEDYKTKLLNDPTDYISYKDKGSKVKHKRVGAMLENKSNEEIEKILKKSYRLDQLDNRKMLDSLKETGKYAYNDPKRKRKLKNVQKKYKSIFDKLSNEEKDQIKSITKNYFDPKSKRGSKYNYLEKLEESTNPKFKKLARLTSEIDRQRTNQYMAKNLGLNAAWTQKLIESPPKGVLGVGKTLYVPGSDKYFEKGFKFDPDDPFFRLKKGNALKTEKKVKVFGNRASATNYALKRYGKGNRLKGAVTLIKANPKRALAGAAILTVGGAISSKLVKSGINTLRTSKRDIRNDKGKKRGKYK